MQGLSGASRYRQAILNDPEVARQIVDREEADKAAGKDPTGEWGPEVRDMDAGFVMLMKIFGAIEELTAIQTGIASQGKKKRKPTRIPPPPTAVAAERERRYIDKHRGILRRLLPHEYTNE